MALRLSSISACVPALPPMNNQSALSHFLKSIGNKSVPSSTLYKTCRVCNATWWSQEQFLSDPELHLIGYQPYFLRADHGLFLFMHQVKHCRTTLSLPVAEFSHLYRGPSYSKCLTGNDACPLYCLDIHNMQQCRNPCSMAWVREIVQEILKMQHAVA
jgi:hypothetical protein